MPVAVSTKDKTWNKMFPTTFKTEQQSLVFMKKLFAVAISNIVYIRSIFPEYAFFDKQLEGIKLKILREDSKCPGASKVITWVRGCFDALDKHYLKTVIIGFYTDPNDPDTVIESYSFKFTYSAEGVSVKLNSEKKSTSNLEAMVKNDDTPEEIKKATLSLLRTMILAGNTQDILPEKVIVTMKLLYYDETTPEDYEPNGFKMSDYAGFRHETETINAKLGHVNTDFHSFRMILRTDKASFTENFLKSKKEIDEEEEESPPNETPNTANNTRSPGIKKTKDSNMECEEEFLVRCPCGGNKDDGIMILCENCKNWQHSVCFCITEEETVPESHVCDVCASEDTNLICTDPKLSALSSEDRRELCLIRRSLVHCRSVDVIEPGQLSEILAVEITVGNGLFCALQNDGVLINPKRKNKNKGLCKVVDKSALENVLAKKYFNKNVEEVIAADIIVQPEVSKNQRKRSNNNIASLSKSAFDLTMEDNDISILNMSQDSMLNDVPLKKKRRACVVKTPVVASRH